MLRLKDRFANARTQCVFQVCDIILDATGQCQEIGVEQATNPKNCKTMSWETFACLLRNSTDGLIPYVETHRVVLIDSRGPWSVADYEGKPATGLTLEAAKKIASALEQEGFKVDIALDPIK